MQPGWLKQFFVHQHDGSCQPITAAETADTTLAEEGVSRRTFVSGSLVAGMAAGAAAGRVVSPPAAAAQEAPNILGDKWWPSPWGAGDEIGASQRITPAKVLEAAKLIKTGKIYRLGMNIEADIPLFGQRHLSLTIPGGPTGGPFGDHKLMYNDEMFSGEIGQVGSQFDGLGHIAAYVGHEIRYYNGFTQEQVGGAYGLKKLGVHNVKPFFTRGILLDILSLKGGERLPIGYVITVEDMQQALSKQNLKEPAAGDVVLFRTGHIKLWKQDNVEFNKGHAGPGETAARWLVERKVACVGADTWAVEAVPGESAQRPFACHVILVAMNGIHIIENQYLEELAQDKVYEFAWSFNPLPLVGATGSPGNAVAIA